MHDTQRLIHILAGSVALSLVHAAIPNHWLPLVAISRVQLWSQRRTLMLTAIVGLAHTLSTILIGLVVGLTGISLTHLYPWVTSIVAPAILAGLGVVYVVQQWRSGRDHHHMNTEVRANKTAFAIGFWLCVAMFFSPCVEIEAYYLVAVSLGWLGVGVVSAVYLLLTVLGMTFLVWVALQGVAKVRWHWLEHYGRGLTGMILIVLALLAYVIEF